MHNRRLIDDDNDDDISASATKWQWCTRRMIIISLVAIVIGGAMGCTAMILYLRITDTNGTLSSHTCNDMNMRRFWYEENAFQMLYYNHSSLANESIFPRVTAITWASLNNVHMQTLLVKQTLWVIQQLLDVCRPPVYVLSWQPVRASMLVQLRAIYQSKLDLITRHPQHASGLIPKWYHAFSDKQLVSSIGSGMIDADGGQFADTWYESVPEWYFGRVQFAVGGDIEIEANISLSRSRAGYDIGNWYIAYPGGMNMTNSNGRTRIAAIMTKTDADRIQVIKLIMNSTSLSSSVKDQMIGAIRPFQLAQVEAQIVRLARAYSPDRGNLMVEGSLSVISDYNGVLASASSLSSSSTILFPADDNVTHRCMNVSRTPSSLATIIAMLRDRDVIQYNHRYGTVYINDTGMYFSDIIATFQRTPPPIKWPTLKNVASRSLLTRVIPHDPSFTKTDATRFAALNLQSWSLWTAPEARVISQVWGRGQGSATSPIDANVLVVNGGVDLTDYNHNISYVSSDCNPVTTVFTYCF